MDSLKPSFSADPLPPPSRSRRFLRYFLIAFFASLVGVISLVIFINTTSPQLLTPLATTVKVLGLNVATPKKPAKVVYGFLPYWNLKSYAQVPYHALTHLAIFGVALEPNGSFQTRESNYTEPGWRAFQLPEFEHSMSLAKLSDTKVILVLRAFDNDLIESIVTSPEATDRTISETLSFVEEHQFDGVNIDFEYTGKAPLETQIGFTRFMRTFHQQLKATDPQLEIDVDVFAISAEGDRLWQLSEIAPYVDRTIIMAYDFHRQASTQAGPVAPLYGAGNGWTHDITSLLSLHLNQTPAEKLILGVPFYGYEWQTRSSDFLSPTVPRTGRTATLSRIHDLLQNRPDISPDWNSVSLSPWFAYTDDDGDLMQIHYEDEQSLGLKYDLVNQANLGGIAIWALGYEPPQTTQWQLILDKFSPR